MMVPAADAALAMASSPAAKWNFNSEKKKIQPEVLWAKPDEVQTQKSKKMLYATKNKVYRSDFFNVHTIIHHTYMVNIKLSKS